MQNDTFYPAVLQAMQACAMDNRGTVHPTLLRRLSEQLTDFFLTPGADAGALAQQFAEVGLALSSVFAGAEGLQTALLDAGHAAEARQVIGALSPLMMAMNDALIALVLVEQEKIRAAAARAEAERQSEIMVQRNEAERLAVLVNELSTPIIPVYSGILILPLIGAIDSKRAGVVMEALLTKITEHTADAVIIDITGVAIVDTFVAQYLLQTARAASLLGTLVIFTGIGAEIAQTMVQIGVDLEGVLTLSDLEAGMEYALRSLNLAIQSA